MLCSRCGTENPACTKLCKECGNRLGLACSNCGIALLPDAKFCGECGTPTAQVVGPEQDAVAGLQPRSIRQELDRGALTRSKWDRPEAEVFAEVAIAMGVPRERILIEDRSTHTGENVVFARRLLIERGLEPATAIAVQKPYMERRTWATFRRQWPELDLVVTSPRITFDAYPTQEITRDDMIQIMVGDLQRIRLYAARGFQIPQEVPQPVIEAYERLVTAGYDRRLIPDPMRA